MLLITQKAGRTGWPIMRDSYVLYSRVMICFFLLTSQPLLHLFFIITPRFLFYLLFFSPCSVMFFISSTWYCMNGYMLSFYLCVGVFVCSGPKGPQKITNWGPAAFTDAELSLREKDWQERKNTPAQTQ